jgi:hypothetical protein
MPSNHIIFAGVDISSGRKPVTFARLDGDLNVMSLERWTNAEAISWLKEYEEISLALNVTSREEIHKDYKKKILQAGLKPPSRNSRKQLIETSTQDCFRALIGKNPLPRRTFEGRLQRASVLYEQGLQIKDPMDVFEEITRYKLAQGIFTLENLYSPTELDALMAAYVAWMAVKRPAQIVAQGEFFLPAQE